MLSALRCFHIVNIFPPVPDSGLQLVQNRFRAGVPAPLNPMLPEAFSISSSFPKTDSLPPIRYTPLAGPTTTLGRPENDLESIVRACCDLVSPDRVFQEFRSRFG